MITYYAISDLEGFYPDQVFPKYKKLNENEKLIICGDVIDSTIAGSTNADIKKLKSNNIKTIFDIVTSPNILLTFGNRDLNKMKVGPLTELKLNTEEYFSQEDTDLVNSFNEGNLDLDLKTYKKLNEVSKQWHQKMSNWYPFWGNEIKNKIDYWKDDNEPYGLTDKNCKITKIYNFFEKRFQKIFGADTSVGTMGATNLLETIPKELGLYSDTNSDYNAFIVLAVFKSMLNPTNFTYLSETNLKKFFDKKYQPINQSMFKGLLFTLFTSEKNNMIIKKCYCICVGVTNEAYKCNCMCESKNTYLFSHGGVSSDIIQNKTLDQLQKLLEKPTELKDKITDANKFITTGGYYYKEIKENLISDEQLHDHITSFNTKIKDTIKAIFKEDYKKLEKPSNNMLLLLIASATFECEPFYAKTIVSIPPANETEDEKNRREYDLITRKKEKCKELDILNTNSNFISTMAGIKELRRTKKIFFIKKNLYNIFGHNPNGFGTTIDLFENDTYKTYLINLDTSNSFLSSKTNASFDKTTSYIEIINEKINIKTHIFIKIEEDDQYHLTNENLQDLKNLLKTNDSDKNFNKKQLVYTGTSAPQEIEINDTINVDMDNILKSMNTTANEKIFYHGVDKNGCIIFTYNLEGFFRCLFVINKEDFVSDFNQFGGNYFKKYLKYKQKYTELKMQIKANKKY